MSQASAQFDDAWPSLAPQRIDHPWQSDAPTSIGRSRPPFAIGPARPSPQHLGESKPIRRAKTHASCSLRAGPPLRAEPVARGPLRAESSAARAARCLTPSLFSSLCRLGYRLSEDSDARALLAGRSSAPRTPMPLALRLRPEGAPRAFGRARGGGLTPIALTSMPARAPEAHKAARALHGPRSGAPASTLGRRLGAARAQRGCHGRAPSQCLVEAGGTSGRTDVHRLFRTRRNPLWEMSKASCGRLTHPPRRSAAGAGSGAQS